METWKLDRSLHQIKRDDSGPTGDQGGGRAGGFINVDIQCFLSLVLGWLALIPVTSEAVAEQPGVPVVGWPDGRREGG